MSKLYEVTFKKTTYWSQRVRADSEEQAIRFAEGLIPYADFELRPLAPDDDGIDFVDVEEVDSF